MSSWKCCAASGMVGSTIRRNPYTPTLDSTPESSASTTIGVER